MRSTFMTIVLLGFAAVAGAATQGGTPPGPRPLFPTNNWWNTDVSAAPLDTNSAAYINFINALSGGSNPPYRRLHPDFGGDAGDGDVYGFPFIIVDGSQAKKAVTFDYWDESDGVDFETEQGIPFYPIPNEAITLNGWVEGGQPGNVDQRAQSDRHILIVDSTNNHLYELYNMWFNGTSWEGGSGAFFNLNSNARRPEGWTSADAAGLAILPGLVRYDEVFGDDEIRHAFRVTVRATNGHVYPASHTAGSTPGALPMGARLRMKANKDISSYSPQLQRIFRAFKRYGLIVADNGSDMYVSGTYDTRWDNDDLNPAFHGLNANDFEVVQLGWSPAISFVLSVQSGVGANEAATVTVSAYDANYNLATGYTGTIQFTSSSNTAILPANYTFTPGDAGTHTFPAAVTHQAAGSYILTATDVSAPTSTGWTRLEVGPPTPANLLATASSTSQVALAWTASAGASTYQVSRLSAGVPYTTIATVGTNAYTDTTVGSGAGYAYRVRALDAAGRPSSYGAPDIATTLVYTDPTLVAGTTSCKTAHIAELRQGVSALRTAAGLAAGVFTDPSLSPATRIKAVHLTELRAQLNEARTALGIPAVSFTDPTLTPGASSVKATHVEQLREGIR